jgi:hypothetical protein
MEGAKVIGAISDIKSIVGKPLDLFSKMPEQHLDTPDKSINWNDFNYPPILQVVHYDSAELPLKAGRIARCLNRMHLLVTLACLVNLVSTCIIVATSSAPLTQVVQSVLNCILLPGFAFLTFYVGYCGIAEHDATFLGRYTCGQIILIAVCAFMFLTPFGCVNGITKLMVMGVYVNLDPALAFVTAIFVESALWLVCALWSFACLCVVKYYDHHRDEEDDTLQGV